MANLNPAALSFIRQTFIKASRIWQMAKTLAGTIPALGPKQSVRVPSSEPKPPLRLCRLC